MCKSPEAGQKLACCQNSEEAPYSWNRVSQGERGRRGGQEGDWQGLAGPWGLGVGGRRTWAFTSREVRALGSCGERRAGPDLGAHGRPLLAAAGTTDCAWGRQRWGARVPGWRGLRWFP